MYLENAQRLTKGSYSFFIKKTDKGILYKYDLPWFVVVLFRRYQELYEVDYHSIYVDAIIAGIDWARENDCD